MSLVTGEADDVWLRQLLVVFLRLYTVAAPAPKVTPMASPIEQHINATQNTLYFTAGFATLRVSDGFSSSSCSLSRNGEKLLSSGTAAIPLPCDGITIDVRPAD